jgi:phage I-like protein
VSFVSAAYCSVLNAGAAPEWIEVIPAGTFATRDGRGPYRNTNPDAVIAATAALDMSAGLPIDYDHATDLAAPEGRPAPAAGWIKQLEVRGGAIWARVEWTEKGAQAVGAGEWRYVSPVFSYDPETMEVAQLQRAALTNNPNLYMTAIASRQENLAVTHDEFRSKMAKMCHLSADASHEEICAAVEKLFKSRDDAADGDAAMSRLIASGRVVSQETHAALVGEVNTLKAERAREKAEALVKHAIEVDHKLDPSQREWAVGYAVSDPTGFETFLSKQKPIVLNTAIINGGKPPAQETNVVALNAVEQKVASLLKLSDEEYAAQRAADLATIENNKYAKPTFHLGIMGATNKLFETQTRSAS